MFRLIEKGRKVWIVSEKVFEFFNSFIIYKVLVF